ncbi:hypothetical protein E3E38_06695 [Thermococcus sp. 18S1]|uniref:hypothetical protein n=1 Tax=Thermococcus sp. 18S1 TaxID=1638210 RepID=UPI00143AD057|nr:hypothetical protein [Thermococcus sp. 18S1]NJE30730.1 hypothetical protein [Thermococcus sp. 18S1]
MSRRRKALAVLFLISIPFLVSMSFEGYTYRYGLQYVGFPSYYVRGSGIACPGIFRAYYQLEEGDGVKFFSTYFPPENDSERFNDPNVVILEFSKNAQSKEFTKAGDFSILFLSRDESDEFLDTHYRLKAIYKGETLRWISFNITHSINYDPDNSSVCVDYANSYRVYEIEATRCWQVLIGWLKPILRWYLRAHLGDVPKPYHW